MFFGLKHTKLLLGRHHHFCQLVNGTDTAFNSVEEISEEFIEIFAFLPLFLAGASMILVTILFLDHMWRVIENDINENTDAPAAGGVVDYRYQNQNQQRRRRQQSQQSTRRSDANYNSMKQACDDEMNVCSAGDVPLNTFSARLIMSRLVPLFTWLMNYIWVPSAAHNLCIDNDNITLRERPSYDMGFLVFVTISLGITLSSRHANFAASGPFAQRVLLFWITAVFAILITGLALIKFELQTDTDIIMGAVSGLVIGVITEWIVAIAVTDTNDCKHHVPPAHEELMNPVRCCGYVTWISKIGLIKRHSVSAIRWVCDRVGTQNFVVSTVAWLLALVAMGHELSRFHPDVIYTFRVLCADAYDRDKDGTILLSWMTLAPDFVATFFIIVALVDNHIARRWVSFILFFVAHFAKDLAHVLDDQLDPPVDGFRCQATQSFFFLDPSLVVMFYLLFAVFLVMFIPNKSQSREKAQLLYSRPTAIILSITALISVIGTSVLRRYSFEQFVFIIIQSILYSADLALIFYFIALLFVALMPKVEQLPPVKYVRETIFSDGSDSDSEVVPLLPTRSNSNKKQRTSPPSLRGS